MQKEDLKSLVTQMYDNLLENIDAQEEANTQQVVSYLRDAIDAVAQIDDSQITSIEQAKSVFNNLYKEIATKSLSSYKYSNEKFQKISMLHEEALSECSEQTIDTPRIMEKFNEVQTHMIEEVQKANQIISKLTSQVEALERDSNIDALTKVFNRRSLISHMRTICSNLDIPYELHLLILDIDDFKVINDTHGHVAGDKILIFIANILKKTLRDGDKIFRYGGEEFVLILNRVDVEHCQKISRRLLELVSKNKLLYKGESINVTISIGSTVYVKGDTPDSLLARADDALYKAKKAGKNTIYSELLNGS